MMHKSNSCPAYLAENNQWSSPMTPYCNCDNKDYCIAPSHRWEFKGTTSPGTWICRNCQKVSD